MRLMIAEVNQKGESDELIINLQDGKGYFRPAKDEDNLVRIWQKLHNSRVSECRENVDAANRYLNRNKKEPKKEDWLAEHQMSLFDGMVG